jgi:hypothetical protein
VTKSDKKPPYPNRPAIITAAKAGDLALRKQLTPDDQLFFDLVAAYPVAGEAPLSSAPAAWIKRAAALADSARQPSRLARLLGALTFDSWSQQPALGTRSVAAAERRVRFEAEGLKLDLRAELRSGQWHFVARIVAAEQPDSPYTLVANDVEVYPDDNGFYHWSSPNPPATVVLKSDDTTVELAPLSWDRNQE